MRPEIHMVKTTTTRTDEFVLRRHSKLPVGTMLIALLLGAVACGSDTDEEPRVVDEPDVAVTPDKGVVDAHDMGADDVFELPGPDLYEMTEEDAIGAWKRPISAQIVDDGLFFSTSSPLPALVETSLDDEPSLKGFVSLRQTPWDAGSAPTVHSMGVGAGAAFAVTGWLSLSQGAWLWTIDRSTYSVKGALRLEGCVSVDGSVPIPVVDSILFVPCGGAGSLAVSVFTVDVSDLRFPKIARTWNTATRSVHLASVEDGTHSFVANRVSAVEYVSIDASDTVTTSEFELSEETGRGHDGIYATMERDDELWVVSGIRAKNRFQGVPESPPTGLLRGFKVVEGELEVIGEYVYDEALTELEGEFSETMWFDGERTLVLEMRTVLSPEDPITQELQVIDVKAQPPSIVRSIDIGGPETGYARVVQMLEHQDELLVVRSSDTLRLPPFQRIPLSDLTLD